MAEMSKKVDQFYLFVMFYHITRKDICRNDTDKLINEIINKIASRNNLLEKNYTVEELFIFLSQKILAVNEILDNKTIYDYLDYLNKEIKNTVSRLKNLQKLMQLDNEIETMINDRIQSYMGLNSISKYLFKNRIIQELVSQYNENKQKQLIKQNYFNIDIIPEIICESCGNHSGIYLDEVKDQMVWQCERCNAKHMIAINDKHRKRSDTIEIDEDTRLIEFNKFDYLFKLSRINIILSNFKSRNSWKFTKKYYVKREEFSGVIIDYLSSIKKGINRFIFVLTGEAGVGKTWLMGKLSYQYHFELNHIVYYINLNRGLEISWEEIFNREIKYADTIVNVARSLDKPIIFIFDGFDEIVEKNKNKFLKFIYKYFYNKGAINIALIIVSRITDWKTSQSVIHHKSWLKNSIYNVDPTENNNIISYILNEFNQDEINEAIERYKLPKLDNWHISLKKYAIYPYWYIPISDRYKKLGYLPEAFDYYLVKRYRKRMGIDKYDIEMLSKIANLLISVDGIDFDNNKISKKSCSYEHLDSIFDPFNIQIETILKWASCGIINYTNETEINDELSEDEIDLYNDEDADDYFDDSINKKISIKSPEIYMYLVAYHLYSDIDKKLNNNDEEDIFQPLFELIYILKQRYNVGHYLIDYLLIYMFQMIKKPSLLYNALIKEAEKSKWMANYIHQWLSYAITFGKTIDSNLPVQKYGEYELFPNDWAILNILLEKGARPSDITIQYGHIIGITINNKDMIPLRISQLTNLRWLELNNIKNLILPDDFFKSLKLLESLTITNCCINKFPNLTKLKNLKYLYLDHNKIKYIPKEISKLKSLEILSVSYNNLINITPKLEDLKYLRELIINHNKDLKYLPDTISNIKNLEYLDFSDCGIEQLPIDMYKLNNLKYLRLSSILSDINSNEVINWLLDLEDRGIIC